MGRLIALSLVALVALAVVGSALGTVKRVSLTTPVIAGSYALADGQRHT